MNNNIVIFLIILILSVSLFCILQSWNRYEKFSSNCAKSWWKHTSKKMNNINKNVKKIKKILSKFKPKLETN